MVLTARAKVIISLLEATGAIIPVIEISSDTIEHVDVRTRKVWFALVETVRHIFPIVIAIGLEVGLYKERIYGIPHGL